MKDLGNPSMNARVSRKPLERKMYEAFLEIILLR